MIERASMYKFRPIHCTSCGRHTTLKERKKYYHSETGELDYVTFQVMCSSFWCRSWEGINQHMIMDADEYVLWKEGILHD